MGTSAGEVSELIKLAQVEDVAAAAERSLKKWVFEDKPQVSDTCTAAKLREALMLDAKKDAVEEAQRMAKDGWEVGSRTITYVLAVLKREGRMEEASELCDRIVARRPQWLKEQQRSSVGQVIGMVYARAGRVDALKELMAAIGRPSVQLVTEIGCVLAEQGVPVVPLVKQMKAEGVRADEVLFRILISRHIDARERALLRQLMRTSRVKVTSPFFHVLLLQQAARRGDAEAAEEGFSFLIRAKTICYVSDREWTMLSNAYSRSGDLSGMLRTDARFKDANASLHAEAKASPVYLSVLLSGYKRYLENHARSLTSGSLDARVAEARALFDAAERLPAFASEAKLFVTAMVGVYAAARRRVDLDAIMQHASKLYNLRSPRELNASAYNRLGAA